MCKGVAQFALDRVYYSDVVKCLGEFGVDVQCFAIALNCFR
mgnify:CR=1 FL=1